VIAARLGLLLFSFALPAVPQDLIRFDPARDLDGFEACFASEFRNLYPLDTYSDLLAKEMNAAALAEIRARWKVDRDAGDERLAALRAKAEEECLWLLRDRLGRSRYFSKIAWTEDRSVPGFVFLVQRPSKDVPDRAAHIAQEYGPWLRKLRDVFEARYVQPLMLERPSRRAVWPIAILSSEGDYLNFWRIHQNYGPESARAGYDHKLGLAVGFEDPFRRVASPIEQRYPILNAFARAMIAAYSSSPDGRPGSLWIEEGLASYLAYHEGIAPDCLDERRIRPSTLQWVLDMAQDRKRGPVLFHPLRDLVALKSSEDVDRIVMRKAEAASLPPPTEREVLAAFYGQATLWMHFLHEGLDGSLRAPFQKYIRWAFSGDAGPGVLKLALEGKDQAAIDRGYLRWLAEEGRRSRPQAGVDTAAIDALFSGEASSAPATPAANGDAAGAPAAPPAFSPVTLAIEAADVESRYGLALLQARAGDIDGAVAALQSLSEWTLAPEDGARVAHELTRLGELGKLRDGFLENLRSSGAKWSTEIGGKKLVASVSRVEGGFVHLAGNRQGIDKLPLSALDPLEISKAATKKEQQGNSAPWARFYAYVLAEDSRPEKLLKEATEEGRSLLEDAKTFYPSKLRSGRAAAAIRALSESSLPTNRADAERVCASLKGLLFEYRDAGVVQRKLGELKRLGRAAAEAVLAEEPPAALLHGRSASIEGDRVRLAYEFDSAVEGRDFLKQAGYLKSWRKAMKLDVKESESAWVVQDGSFTGIGAACYRLPVAFAAPVTVRYEVKVHEGRGQGGEQANFAVGLCDDRKESYVLCANFGGLVVVDRPKGIQVQRVEKSYTYVPDTVYTFEVRHDGRNASVLVDGDVTAEASCETRKQGDVFLWFHSSLPISIDRFEVEARIDPESARGLRASCVEGKLAEMGFP